jgi:hypothetical protein
MKWKVNDTAEVQSKENLEKITWESMGKARKMRRMSMWLIHDMVYDSRDSHP